jgi:hypothetical protein
MKRIVLALALCLPSAAFAGGSPCPQGINTKLTDTTTASTANSTATNTGSQGTGTAVRNHFPH